MPTGRYLSKCISIHQIAWIDEIRIVSGIKRATLEEANSSISFNDSPFYVISQLSENTQLKAVSDQQSGNKF